jgi:predicted RNA-binding protein with PUA-like domain
MAQSPSLPAPPAPRYWLAKTEPEVFGWEHLLKKGVACWDGVRNVEARNNLRAMHVGDRVFIYHTGKHKEVVGLSQVVREAYRDPTSSQAIWSAVDVEANSTSQKLFLRPVTLAELKAEPLFKDSPLARKPRLSVMPITQEQADRIFALAASLSLS